MVSKKDEEEASKDGSEAAGWRKERWYGTSYKVRKKRQAYFYIYSIYGPTALTHHTAKIKSTSAVCAEHCVLEGGMGGLRAACERDNDGIDTMTA